VLGQLTFKAAFGLRKKYFLNVQRLTLRSALHRPTRFLINAQGINILAGKRIGRIFSTFVEENSDSSNGRIIAIDEKGPGI
jgi:hypothetical protein